MFRCIAITDKYNGVPIWIARADCKENDKSVLFSYRPVGSIVCDILNNDYSNTFLIPTEKSFFGQMINDDGEILLGKKRTERINEERDKMLSDPDWYKNKQSLMTEFQSIFSNDFCKFIENVFVLENNTFPDLKAIDRFFAYIETVFVSYSYTVNFKSISKMNQSDVVFSEAYEEYKNRCNLNRYALEFAPIFESLKDLVYACIHDAALENIQIKKCANCGKYFIPLLRSDTIYCDNPSPQDNTKTCKVFGAAKKRAEKEKNDEVTRLYRRIYMSKQMLVIRHSQDEDHVLYDVYQTSFQKFKLECEKWKRDIKSGNKTEEKFLEWLRTVKEKKVL